VLVYQSEPLAGDLAVAGPIKVRLHVSTTGTDADFVVKLVDVYPDDYPDPRPNPRRLRMGGYQQLVRGWLMRAKFRASLSRPEPMVPGRVTPIAFTMPDAYHAFRRGHRIMVQVQSSWFPLIDRNPQVFTDIYRARPRDFRRATQRVFRTREHPSCIELGVLEGPR
jgi:putative CocE/NonD family hydrolase